MKMSPTILFFLLVCMLASFTNAESMDEAKDLIRDRMNRKLSRHRDLGEDDEATLERIRKHDQMRTKRMEELIVQRTQQLKDHEAGHRRLSEDDHTRFNRQIKAFQRKLDQVKSMSDEEYENSMQEMARSINQMNTMGMPDL